MRKHTSSARRLSARRRLVFEELRQHSQQTWLNALGLAFVVAIMLTLSEVTLMPPRHRMVIIIVLRWTIAAMIWFALFVAIVVMAINRVSQVRERTRQFAILRMLGASFSFVALLLAEETIVLATLGSVIGIAIASLVGWLTSAGLPDLFGYEIDLADWLRAGCLAAVCFFFVGVLTAWVTTRQQDVLSSLSYK